MPTISVSLDEKIKKIIEKRAKKNLLSLREQAEEILRQSAVRTKSGDSISKVKVDDRLVEVFSRDKRGKSSRHGQFKGRMK